MILRQLMARLTGQCCLPRSKFVTLSDLQHTMCELHILLQSRTQISILYYANLGLFLKVKPYNLKIFNVYYLKSWLV